MKGLSKVDPVLWLLFLGMLVFTAILLYVEKFYPNDGQIFQVISGLVTGFAGAFFARMKPDTSKPPEPPGTQKTEVTITQPEPVKEP